MVKASDIGPYVYNLVQRCLFWSKHSNSVQRCPIWSKGVETCPLMSKGAHIGQSTRYWSLHPQFGPTMLI
ncbi:hypothetical protein, partial [Acinetobacter baumannii]|uniref:hypothetical protein n=1 Tax=Acinetobacter baumannii TaxID=470 RepID=UPI001C07155E